MEKVEIIRDILSKLRDGKAPANSDYNLELPELASIVQQMLDDNLIVGENAIVRSGIGNNVTFIAFNLVRITTTGRNYLNE